MKLASLRDGTAQGRLVIVSADQSTAVRGTAARTLLAALQDWKTCERLLRAQAGLLENGTVNDSFVFDARAVLAPIPQAPQWLDASAFRTHSELVAHTSSVIELSGSTLAEGADQYARVKGAFAVSTRPSESIAIHEVLDGHASS